MKPIYIAYSSSLLRLTACAISLAFLGRAIYLLKSGREMRLLALTPLISSFMIILREILDTIVWLQYTQIRPSEVKIMKKKYPSLPEATLQILIIRHEFILQALKIFRDRHQEIRNIGKADSLGTDPKGDQSSAHDTQLNEDLDINDRIIDAIVSDPQVSQGTKRPLREYLKTELSVPLEDIISHDYPQMLISAKEGLTISKLTDALSTDNTHCCNIIKKAVDDFRDENTPESQQNGIVALGYAQFYVHCLDRLDFLIQQGAKVVFPVMARPTEIDAAATSESTTTEASSMDVRIECPSTANSSTTDLAKFLEIIVDNCLMASESLQTFHKQGIKTYAILQQKLDLINALVPSAQLKNGKSITDHQGLLGSLNNILQGLPGKPVEEEPSKLSL